MGPPQAAMDNYGIEKDDYVLLRNAKIDDPRINPKQRPKLCAVFFKVAATLVQWNNIVHVF